jgi:uncharacterized protein YndB with AHSA1/START domain
MSRQDEQEINIHAPVDAIWRALTEAEELKRWLVESAHVEPEVGGVYRLIFGDGLETDWRIATWQPGERLRLVSQMPTSTGEPVVEEYTLEKGESAIVLRVVTSGIPDTPDWDGFVEGTRKGRVLASYALRHYLERHLGKDRHLSKLTLATQVPAATAWAGLMGPAGLGADTGRFRVADSAPRAIEDEILCVYESYGLLATIESLDGGLLAVGMSPGPDGTLVWVSLSTFGDQRLAANEAELRLRSPLERALNLSESDKV